MLCRMTLRMVYSGDMSKPKITVTDSVYSRGRVGARVVKTDAISTIL